MANLEEPTTEDTDHDDVRFVEVPDQVKHQILNQRIRWNSGGGPCLFKAVAQHITDHGDEGICSYVDLRRYIHQKLVDWWAYFESFYFFPIDIRIGAGNDSQQIFIQSATDFQMFLLSDDSLEAFNELEVELWVICYALKCDIDVLSYNLREGGGENGGRSKWSEFLGKGIDPEGSLFLCNGKKMTLLYENNAHWQLIVPDENCCEKVSEIRIAPTSDSVQMPISTGSGSSGSILSTEASISKSKILNSIKSSRRSKLASNAEAKASKLKPAVKDVSKNARTIKSPVGEEKKKRKSEIFNSEEEMCPKVRKLKKIKPLEEENASNQVEDDPFVVKEMMTDKNFEKVAVKSDVYHIFRVKEPSLEDILKVPEQFEEVKAASLDALDIEIIERKKKHEEEMANVEKVIQGEKENQRNRRKRFRINTSRRNKLEVELDEIKLAFMFEKYRKQLEGIEKLEVFSARYKAFCKGGVKKDELKMKLFLAPFSDHHIDFILTEMEASWMKTRKEQMDKNDLIWKVLLPEFLTLVIIEHISSSNQV